MSALGAVPRAKQSCIVVLCIRRGSQLQDVALTKLARTVGLLSNGEVYSVLRLACERLVALIAENDEMTGQLRVSDMKLRDAATRVTSLESTLREQAAVGVVSKPVIVDVVAPPDTTPMAAPSKPQRSGSAASLVPTSGVCKRWEMFL